MKPDPIQHALQIVAEKRHISQDQLLRELDALIADTLAESARTGDVQSLAAWQKIPTKNSVPTAEELILYLARQITNHL